MNDERGLTIEELAEQVAVPVRTVRFYIAEGLLPGPEGRGKSASYSQEHLLRLQLIRRLSEQRIPLSEQRERLQQLSVDEVRAVLREEETHNLALQKAQEAPSAREYVAALLGRARAARQPPTAPPPAVPSPTAPPPAPPAAAPPAAAPPVAAPQPPAASVAEEAPAPLAPLARADDWHRWELGPGVELHVRADARERQRPLIERLLGMVAAQAGQHE